MKNKTADPGLAKAAAARDAASAPAKTPAQKAADMKKTLKKRQKQYRHIKVLLRSSIRILNSVGHRTIYRK